MPLANSLPVVFFAPLKRRATYSMKQNQNVRAFYSYEYYREHFRDEIAEQCASRCVYCDSHDSEVSAVVNQWNWTIFARGRRPHLHI